MTAPPEPRTAAEPGATLAGVLARIERGEQLPTDPWLRLVPAPAVGRGAVVSFPGHIVISADLDPAWVHDQLPEGDLSAPLNPPFLSALERQLGLRVNNTDALYLAPPADGPPEVPLQEVADLGHPRVRRARRYRPHVRVWTTDGGMLVVGQGLADRWEAAIEVAPSHRGRGLGRRLAAAARHLVPAARPVWAQIAPANAASVRAFLAAGFQPVGAEALLVPAAS